MNAAGWQNVYEPLIGHAIRALVWMPMLGDTPGVVADLERTSFSFSGGAFLAFDSERKLLLTWMQVGDDMVLGEGFGHWSPFGLDRVRCLQHGEWKEVEGAVLKSAQLYAEPLIGTDHVVGIRHSVSGPSGETHFWIGTGCDDRVGDADDLWVGVGVEPLNLESLSLVG